MDRILYGYDNFENEKSEQSIVSEKDREEIKGRGNCVVVTEDGVYERRG